MRLIEIRSPALDAQCFALMWRAQERLSEEPRYRLELQTPNPDLDLETLLGDAVGIDIDLDNGVKRRFHAHVFTARDTGQMQDKYTYELELASWLSFLAENQNSRIFQNLSVPQIVDQVFAGHRRADYRWDLARSYEPREYCVQFCETDLQFVKRLLEDEGIYFWVEHETERHVVVLSDTQRFADQAAPYTTLQYLPDGEEHRAISGREGVQRLQRMRRVRPNNVALRDFNYHVPSNRLDADAQVQQDTLAGITLEHYQYAAGYGDTERGGLLARLRLEAYQAESHMLQGQANARGLSTGQAFTLVNHPDAQRNRRFFVTDSDLNFVQDGPDSSSKGRNVAVQFHALHDDQPFHPLLSTQKPALPGIQSATVVGPPDSEVHTDKLGRIRVHFHWDRYKSTEEDSSCWIRVSQAWAGKGWGVIAMPRVGQEVLVTYVDGDLDRPLVIGIVYNGDNPTPYDLPKDIRYTGIVTRSLKHGGVEHANQLTFDDERGAERVMIHAQQDLQHTVERNASMAVGQDMNTQVADTITTTTTNDILYRANAVTITGTEAEFTGASARYRGSVLTNDGTNTSNTGALTAVNGTSDLTNGTLTSTTGTETATTGTSTTYTGYSSSVTGISDSTTGISISKTGVRISFTGVAMDTTGVANSVVGIANSVTGVSTSVKGVDVSLTGVAVSITGVAISHTAQKIELKDLNLQMIGMKIIM
jgi:type VI secretion system secreted protein VgrG